MTSQPNNVSREDSISALLERFRECDLTLNEQISDELVKLDSDVLVSGLLDILQTPTLPPFVHKQAVKVLGRLDTNVVPTLLQALRHSNVDVKKLATVAIGNAWDRPNWTQDGIVPPLLQALSYQNFELNRLAAQSLGQFGSRLSIADLSLILSSHELVCNAFRESFKKALARQGRAAIPNLLSALEHPSADIRSLAAEGLWCVGTEAEVPALLEALKDSDSSVRTHAEAALKKIRNPQSTLLPAARAYVGFWNNDIAKDDTAQFIKAMREKGFTTQSNEDLIEVFQQIKALINTSCRNAGLAMAAKQHVFASMGRNYNETTFFLAMQEQGFGGEPEEELLKAYLQAHQAAQSFF